MSFSHWLKRFGSKSNTSAPKQTRRRMKKRSRPQTALLDRGRTEPLEDRLLLAADLVVDATLGGVAAPNDGIHDEFVVKLNGSQLEIHLNGNLVFSDAQSNVNSLEVIGSSDDDTLEFVETADGLPNFLGDLALTGGTSGTAHNNPQLLASSFPSNIGVHIDGGTGINSFHVRLQSGGQDIGYFADDLGPAKSGNVGVGNDFALSFANLTPMVFVGAGGTLTLDATSTPLTSMLTLSDTGAPGDGVNIVTGDGGFEDTTFSGFDALVIRGGDGAETITAASIDAADPDGGGPGAALTSITLDGDNIGGTDTGADTINLQDLPATVSATLLGGAGSDTFNIGSVANSLGAILGSVMVDGETHDSGTTTIMIKSDSNTLDSGDILNLNDQGEAGSFTYTVVDETFVRTGIALIEYRTVETLNLNTSLGAADVDVITTADGVNTNITTQDAADDIDVATTGLDSNVIINTAGGADDVDLVTTGGDGPDGNALGSFTQVNAGDDGDTLTLRDTGATGRVELNGQAGTNTINIRATGSLSVTNVNGGANTDTINIGTVANSLSGILGDICVDANAHDAGTTTIMIKSDSNTLDSGDILNLNDQGDAGSFTYALDATTFARTGTGTITYATIETLNLNTSLGTADVDVTNTAAGVNTSITTQNAADDIDIATTGLDSNVGINTFGGADDISIVTTGGDGGDAGSLGSFTIVNSDSSAAPAAGDTITLLNSGAASRVHISGQEGTDTVNVEATGTLSVTNVDGGDNTDTVNIGTPANSLSGILGDICVEGGSHDAGTVDLTIRTDTNTLDTGDILNLNDQGDAGSFTYALDATTFARTGTGTITYATIETLNLNTSLGGADVDVTSTADGISTNLTTQDAADDIDVATTGLDSSVIINTAAGADDINLGTTGGDGPDGSSLGSFTQVNASDDADSITLEDHGAASRVELNGQAGTDTINIWATGALGITNVNGGANTDTINVGTPVNSITGILGSIFVNGDSHDAGTTDLTIKSDTNTLDTGDTLNVNDQGDAGAFTYVLIAGPAASFVSRTGIQAITYSTVETLNLNASVGSADLEVRSTAAGVNMNITTQDAADDIEVLETGADSSLTINAGAGADDIEIVTTGGDGGDADALGSFTLVNAGDDGDSFTLRDSGAAGRVELNGQGGSDTVNIRATGVLSVTNINGGDNTDTINIGSTADSLSGLLGDICISGDAHDAGTVDLTIKTDTNTLDTGDILNLNDQGDAGSFTYALDATTFARTGTGTITYATIETLNLNTSLGGADVDVTSTADGISTSITTQDAADDIDVATTGLDSSVIINTAAGADDIDLVTTGGDGPDGNSLGSFTQVNSGDDADMLTLEDSGAASRVELNGQAGQNTINIRATGVLSVMNINGGSNSDTVNIGSAANSLGGILGDICVDANAHDAGTIDLTIKTDTNTLDTGDILNLNDQGDAGSFTYALDATTFARTGTGTITYATIETLNLNTSLGGADVDVTSTADGISTSITTQDAADDIDIATTGLDSSVIINTAAGADDIALGTTGGDGPDGNSLGSFTQVNSGDDADSITLEDSGAASRVELNGQIGTDTINIWATGSLSVTNVNGGDNSDVIRLGTPANSLGGILGDICVGGDAHDAGTQDLTIKSDTNTLDTGDVLLLNDHGDAGSFTYALDATTFARTGTGTVTYGSIESINLSTSIGSADVDVTSTTDGAVTFIMTQDAADTVDVATSGLDSSVTIQTLGGADMITLVTTGGDGPDGNALGSFTHVNGGNDGDILTLQDSGAASRINLTGVVGTDTFNVLATGALSVTDVDGGDNTDTINIGSAADSLGGILGDICINGDAHDAGTVDLTIKTDTNTLDSGDILNLNDQGDAGSFTYALDGTTFARTGTGTVTYATIETLNLNTSLGGADVDVTSTADGISTSITTQDAADDIDVATSGLDSSVIINTAAGADDVDLVTTGGDGPDGGSLGSFTQVNAGDDGDTLTLEDSGAASRVELNGQAGSDTVNIWATGALSVTNTNGGDNSDTVSIGTPANSLSGILGDICVNGDAHDAGTRTDTATAKGTTVSVTLDTGDILNLNDQGDAGSFTYALGAMSFARTGTGTVDYSTVETLNLNTSIGASDVDVSGTPMATITNIATQDAADDIDVADTGAGSITSIATAGGTDNVRLEDTGDGSVTTVTSESDGDTVEIGGTGTGSGLNVSSGDAGDNITLENTGMGSAVDVDAEAGMDTVTVLGTGAMSASDINGGADDDMYFVQVGVLFGVVCFSDAAAEGTDELNIAGTSGLDNFEIDGMQTVVNTIQLITYSPDLETINVDGDDGADDFEVSPSMTATFHILGGNPTMSPGDGIDLLSPPGETTTLAFGGAAQGTFTTTGGFQDVLFDEIDDLTFIGSNLTLNGTAEDDLFDLNITSSGAGTLGGVNDVDGMPGPTTMLPLISFLGVDSLVVNGSDGDDVFRQTNTGGPLGLLNGVTFNGGMGSDAVEILGGTATDVTHRFTNENDGSVEADGFTLNYTGLEPVLDTITATTRTFSFTSTMNETVVLSDDMVMNDDMSLIDSDQGESVTFLSPTGSLTIETNTNGGSGFDLIDVEGLDGMFDSDLTIEGGTDDIVSFITNPTDVGTGDVTSRGVAVGVLAPLSTMGGDITFETTEEIFVVAPVDSMGGNITFNADTDQAMTPGGNVIIDGVPVTSAGGNIVIGGGSDPLTMPALSLTGPPEIDGVHIHDSLIDAGTGDISIRGSSDLAEDGVDIGDNSLITSTTGSITIDGTSTGMDDGVDMHTGAAIATMSGDISITGTSTGPAAEDGVLITADMPGTTAVTTNTGSITITGTGATTHSGVQFDGPVSIQSTGASGAGAIAINGTANTPAIGSEAGVFVAGGASIMTVSGTVDIDGTNPAGDGAALAFMSSIQSSGTGADAAAIDITGNGEQGVVVFDSSITSADGDISIDGTGADEAGLLLGDATISSSGTTAADAATIMLMGMSTNGIGVDIFDDATGNMLSTVAGDIGITGMAPTGTDGVLIEPMSSITSTGTAPDAGSITIHGTGGVGDGIHDDGIISSVDGDVQLTGSAPSGDDGIEVDAGSIQTTGTGNVTLNSTDTTAAGEDITLGAVMISSAMGNVTFNSGDTININAGSTLSAGMALTFNVDVGNADPGVGETLTLQGNLSGGTQILATGEADNDIIDGSALTVGFNAIAGAGDDSVTGGSGDDKFFGSAGRDTLVGGEGADTLLGQGGTGDQLTGGPGNDVMNGGAGTDLIRESADGDFDLNPSQLIGTVTGTDTLIDIEKAWLEGGAGNNNINAEDFPGSVTLSGFSGSDTLVGGPEIDILYGEDSLNSGGAADTIVGNGGDDLIYGQDGDDSVDGGDGNDMIRGASGRDILNGDAGDDQIFGQGASGDQLRGGAGNDTLDGGAGNDIVTETADTDFDLDGTGGNGTLDGGGVTGTDTLISTEFARLTGGASGNTIDASGWDSFATLSGAGGDDVITGAEGGSILNGDDGADMLQGGSVADTINGGTGNDSAHGGDGGDTINGNDDDDQLDGGLGNDTIGGGAGNDRIVGGSNTDYTPDMPVDATTLNDTDEDSLLGGSGDDTIKGGLGSDIADGEAGADVIDMGSGGDTTDGIDSVVGGDMADLIFIDPEDLLI